MKVRPLPQDPAAETAVIGSMMLDAKCVFKVLQHVSAGDFYKEANQKLFKTIIELHDQKKPIDPVVMADELKRAGDFEVVGGVQGLMAFRGVHSSANVEHYCQIVKEKSLARKCIREMALREHELYEGGDPEGVLNELFNFCTTDFGKSGKDFECDLGDLLGSVLEKIEKAQKGERKPHIPSRFVKFDAQFKGWECGSLTVLLAPPKVGKSMFMINSADRIAQAGNKVGYILLDMMRDKIIFRFLSRRLKRTIAQIEYGIDVRPEDISRELGEIASLPLKVAGQQNIGHDYKACLRFMQYARKNFGTEIFFIDSFQKFDVKPEKGQTDESFISQMINDFQAVAQELDVAVVGTVDQNYEGKAKGSSRWGAGPDCVFGLALNEADNALVIKSIYVRNTAPGEVILTTNYSNSELMDYERREEATETSHCKKWEPD